MNSRMPALRLFRDTVSIFLLHSLIVLAPGADLAEPVFEGHPVSFWLDELPFVDVDETGQNIQKGYPDFYENLAQAEAHQKKIESIRKNERMLRKPFKLSAPTPFPLSGPG